jgi:hypothetical protein
VNDGAVGRWYASLEGLARVLGGLMEFAAVVVLVGLAVGQTEVVVMLHGAMPVIFAEAVLRQVVVPAGHAKSNPESAVFEYVLVSATAEIPQARCECLSPVVQA